MNQFFTTTNAGERYQRCRPKVHNIVVEWLRDFTQKPFKRAIDVACGTGDSSLPLLEICDELTCIDSSEEMLAVARGKGLNSVLSDYSEIPRLGKFDLISTCMAFHWFDPALAIKSYKAASLPGAVWIIYNFAFKGHATNQRLNEWLQNDYLQIFPTPPRQKSSGVVPTDDGTINLVSSGAGWIPIEFNLDTLIGYLCTQSNVEQALRNGAKLQNIEKSLRRQLEKMDLSGIFKYQYTYDIYRYCG